MSKTNRLLDLPSGTVDALKARLGEAGMSDIDVKKLLTDEKFARRVIEYIRQYRVIPSSIIGEAEKVFPSPKEQIGTWAKIIKAHFNKSCQHVISEKELRSIPPQPEIGVGEETLGYAGSALCYGFASEAYGAFADILLTTQIMADIAHLWDEQFFVDDRFSLNDRFVTVRKNAISRPKGFFWAKFQLGHAFQGLSDELVLSMMHPWETGASFEILQLSLLSPAYAKLLNGWTHPNPRLFDICITYVVKGHVGSESPILSKRYPQIEKPPYLCLANPHLIDRNWERNDILGAATVIV